MKKKRPLTAADWYVLIAVALAQVIVTILLRSLPLPVLRACAARIRPLAQFIVRSAQERTVWAIEATGRRLGCLSTCLARAIVAQMLLGSPERPGHVAIGVRRTAHGTLDGHAWLVRDGRVLVGESSDHYVPFVTWT